MKTQTKGKSSHRDWKQKLHLGIAIRKKRSLSSRSIWRWTGVPRLSILKIPSCQPRLHSNKSVHGIGNGCGGLTGIEQFGTCPETCESSEIYINGKSPTLSLKKLPLSQHHLSPFTKVQKKLFDEEVARTDQSDTISNSAEDTGKVPFAHSSLLRKRFAPKQQIASGPPCDSCIKTRACRVLLSPKEVSRKTEEEHKENFQFQVRSSKKTKSEHRGTAWTSSAVDQNCQNGATGAQSGLNRIRIPTDMKRGSDVLSELCQSAMGGVVSERQGENGECSKWTRSSTIDHNVGRDSRGRGMPPWRPLRRDSLPERTQNTAWSRDYPSTSGCSNFNTRRSPPQKRVKQSESDDGANAGGVFTRNYREQRGPYFDRSEYGDCENDAGRLRMNQSSGGNAKPLSGYGRLAEPEIQEIREGTGGGTKNRADDLPYRTEIDELKQQLRTMDKKPPDGYLSERKDSRHGDRSTGPTNSMPLLKPQLFTLDRHVLRLKRPRLTPAIEIGPKLRTPIEEETTNFGTVGGVLASLRRGERSSDEKTASFVTVGGVLTSLRKSEETTRRLSGYSPAPVREGKFLNKIDRNVFRMQSPRVTPAVDLGPNNLRTSARDMMTGTGGVEKSLDGYDTRVPQNSEVSSQRGDDHGGDDVDSGLLQEDESRPVARIQPLVDYEMDEEEAEHGEVGVATDHADIDAAGGDDDDDDDDDVILESVTTPRGLRGTQISSLMTDFLRSNGANSKVPSPEEIYEKLQEVFGLKIARWERFVWREYSRLTVNRPQPSAPTQSERVLVTVGRYSLTATDMATLDEDEWLNDNIINAYLHLLSEKAYLKMIGFSSFFYQVYNQKGFEHAHRWHRKSDLFSFHLILIPIHSRHHWCMVVVNLEGATITYYDSMRHSGMTYLKKVRAYMDQEAAARGRSLVEWTLQNCDGLPKQRNDSDCGVFVCQYGKRLGFCKDVTFSHAEAAGFRAQMKEELLLRQVTPPT